ncbi:MAG: hypothetical protein JXA90_10840 [Planctomycetes bacterium]|nr:hypothetical protein [Planctomycetota bacterium]
MFGRRPDATLVRDAPELQRFLPLLSRRRSDSLVFFSTEIPVDSALQFLRERNRGLPRERRTTLLHLIVRSMAIGLHTRPGLNRFASAGRLWQRRDVAITLSAKREIADGSPVITVKRLFPAAETFDAMVDGVQGALRSRRERQDLRSDREISLALRLPPFVSRAAIRALQAVDALGLLPRSLIDGDPLFTSVFVAHLGSVGLDAAYHHLWEYGTCSIFAAIGRIRRRPDGKRAIEIRYSFDERIADGLYAAITLREVRRRLEHPELLL